MYKPTCVFVFFLTLYGCGKSDRLETYTTSGTVKYVDGELIEEGTVMFVAAGLPPGRALIEQGKFNVGTYEESDGAVEGRFQVGVLVSPPIDYDPDAGRPPMGAKAKYGRPETSGLAYDVTPDGENHFEILLERGK